MDWKNLPNKTTPLNNVNLNKSDSALRIIDDRVITLDSTKFNKSEANGLIKNFQLDTNTGVITITWYDNSTVTIATALSKIAVNFDYDNDPTSSHYKSLILYDVEGQVLQYVDLSALITEFDFVNSDTILFNTTQSGEVSATIRNGSVTDEMLESEYLANVTSQAQTAVSAADSASIDADRAEYNKNLAISYAVGTNGEVRDIDATDNAKSYKENSEAYAVGTRNGVPVSSTDVTYENNAKYWAERASEQAVTPIMTNSIVGKGRPDGTTIEVDNNGVFKAKGVAVYCTINEAGTEYGADWLLYGNTVIVPSNIQLYMVYIDNKPTLWAWNGTQYVKVSADGSGNGGLVSILKADYDILDNDEKNNPDIWWWISDIDGSVSSIEVSGGGTTNYNELSNQPQINGVTLEGNKTSSQLGINIIDDYTDLSNKPSINNIPLTGNKTSSDLGINVISNYNDLSNRPQINGHVLTGNQTAEDLGISGGGGGVTDYDDLLGRPQINGHILTGNQSTSDLGISDITDYDDLSNRPQINGHTLTGNQSASDLGINATGDYTDLTNRPQINGVTLTGNQTASDLGLSDISSYSDLEDLPKLGSYTIASALGVLSYPSVSSNNIVAANSSLVVTVNYPSVPSQSVRVGITGIKLEISGSSSMQTGVAIGSHYEASNLYVVEILNTTSQSLNVTVTVQFTYLQAT